MASQKFILPNGGKIVEDKDFRGISEDRLSLPFPVICLEFPVKGFGSPPGSWLSSKRAVICSEEKEFISIKPVVFVDERNYWVPMPEVKLPREGWVNKSIRGPEGWPEIFPVFADSTINTNDYADEVLALLELLNALGCSNVTTERTPVKNGKQKAGALPFDSYHYLVLRNRHETGGAGRTGIGSGRSPREHLRRGHIRRLSSGAKTWVNATVVSAGRTGGTVRKTYVVRP